MWDDIDEQFQELFASNISILVTTRSISDWGAPGSGYDGQHWASAPPSSPWNTRSKLAYYQRASKSFVVWLAPAANARAPLGHACDQLPRRDRAGRSRGNLHHEARSAPGPYCERARNSERLPIALGSGSSFAMSYLLPVSSISNRLRYVMERYAMLTSAPGPRRVFMFRESKDAMSQRL